MKAKIASMLVGVTALAVGVGVWAGGNQADRAPLTEKEVRARAEAQGYTVTRVERENEGYEVKAVDKEGRRVELEFSASDGSAQVEDDD